MTQVMDTQLDWTALQPAAESFPLTVMQSIVLNIFKARGNLTDTELCTHYNLIWHTQGWPACRFETPRKRRSDLARLGLLRDSADKRDNGFGSLETVWVVAS